MMDGPKIFPELRLVARNSDRPPPLTDAELIAIRKMLAEHEAIMYGCPLARRFGEELAEGE